MIALLIVLILLAIVLNSDLITVQAPAKKALNLLILVLIVLCLLYIFVPGLPGWRAFP